MFELKQVMQIIQAQYILDIVDADGSGTMNTEDFTHFVYICKNAVIDDIKTILFLAADKDCSLSISKSELLTILKKLGAEVNQQMVDELVDQVADNEDGTLSYDLFNTLMERLIE
ncbi:EF_hand domain-containing protein [Hexamita inflata]|uniref:EF hand domain-containing protein n=1 Tax=Hexamita inflata TaxID=28002 RepID=A0AA86U332_9EUKA|nr:EF hand domain-containing protein [Hexamita inflata]